MTGTIFGAMIYDLQHHLKKQGFELSYDQLATALTESLNDFNKKVMPGETFSMPDGSTYVKTYEPFTGHGSIKPVDTFRALLKLLEFHSFVKKEHPEIVGPIGATGWASYAESLLLHIPTAIRVEL